MSDEDEGISRRISERRRTILGGRIYNDDGDAWDCTIKDLSEAGAKVRTDAALENGTCVDLKVNKFEDLRRAEVIWVRGSEAGLRFLVKIDRVPESMRRLFSLVQGSKKN